MRKNKKPTLINFSKYVSLFLDDETACLFHSMTMEKLLMSRETLNNKFNDRPNAKNFGNVHFTKSFDIKIQNRIQNYKKQSEPNFKQLYLIVSEACNLKCKYCRQVTHDFRGKRSMTSDELDKVLEMFFRMTNNEPAGIVFYGGEPLINKRIIVSAVQTIRKKEKDLHRKRPVDLTLITNGILIDNETAQHLAKGDVYIIVSLDGTAAENDMMRVYAGGRGSFPHIMRGYKIFKKAGCKIGISCTIGSQNYNKLEKIFHFFKKELHPVNVGINLPHDNEFNPLRMNMDYRAMCDSLFKISEKKEIYIEHIMRKMNLLFKQENKINDCPACGYRLVYLPGGRWGNCEGAIGMEDYFFDHIDKVKEVSKTWFFTSPLFDPSCQTCPALGLCGGGCPLDGFLQGGKIGVRDDRRCYFLKTLVEWGIKRFLLFAKDRLSDHAVVLASQQEQLDFLEHLASLNEALPLRSSANFSITKT